MGKPESVIAVIETSKGTIRVKLFADKVPITVGNFVNLVRRKYYDGLKFHRPGISFRTNFFQN